MYCSSALWSEACDIPQYAGFPPRVHGRDVFYHEAKVIKSQVAAVDGKINSDKGSSGAQKRCLWYGVESPSGAQRRKSYRNPGEVDQKSPHQKDLNKSSRRGVKADCLCVCVCVCI